ncbi:hypothetical protein XF24_00242 [candidate division SR1 bacterium Aalborg_AAW-1]|nr:hypothetical protein XF24_00242 [candidate division SR1 bacterium Aalborg_AAW-1]
MISTRWKKIFFTLLIIGFSSYSGPFSYAQETPSCLTCGSMAPELQDYIIFANQIVDALDTKTDIISNGLSYNIFGPWQGGTYNGILVDKNPSGLIQSIVLGTLKNIDRRQSQVRGTIEVLSIYTTDIIKDGSLGFLVASQPWPIMRDFQYLLDIDTMISDKIYDLGTMGMQGKTLTEQERTTILEILKNNTGEGKIFSSEPNLSPSITSTDILRLLLRINNRNKKTLTLSTTKIDNTVTANNSTLTLSKKHFENMVQKYKCVRIGSKAKSCGGSREDFKKSIDNITKSFIETGPKQSWNKINTAYKRLITRGKIIMGSENINKKELEEYMVKEHELITSRGDGQTLTKRTGRGIITGALSSNIPRMVGNIWSEVMKEGKELSTLRKSSQENITSESNNNFSNKEKKIIETATSTPQLIITNSMVGVIESHHTMKTQQLNVSTQDSQETLAKITYRIRVINNILSTTIKEDLTRTCNLQCSNLGGICG